MIRIFLTISAVLFWGFATAQTTTRIALANLEQAKTVEGTKAGQIPLSNTTGNLRYAQMVEVNPTAVAYTPTATGNTGNLSEFVYGSDGNLWYIDWQGNATKMYKDDGYSLGPVTGSGSPSFPFTLLNNSINDTYIQQNTVDSTELQTRGVGMGNIAQSGAASGMVLTWNGTNWVPRQPPAADNWEEEYFGSITGNTITTTGTLPTVQQQQRILVYRSGVKMRQGVDYTISGNNVSLTIGGLAESFTIRYK